MNHEKWDGTLPRRRYAIFKGLFCGDYAIVVRGKDLETAPRWGGFVCWLGGIHPAEKRDI